MKFNKEEVDINIEFRPRDLKLFPILRTVHAGDKVKLNGDIQVKEINEHEYEGGEVERAVTLQIKNAAISQKEDCANKFVIYDTCVPFCEFKGYSDLKPYGQHLKGELTITKLWDSKNDMRFVKVTIIKRGYETKHEVFPDSPFHRLGTDESILRLQQIKGFDELKVGETLNLEFIIDKYVKHGKEMTGMSYFRKED